MNASRKMTRVSATWRQTGVSLIELMVAILIGLILIAGLFQVYLSSKQSYNAQEQLARMQESGRFAMDLITADLRRAGYWGGSVDLTRISRGVPGAWPPSPDCNIDTNWGRMIRWRVSGLNGTNAGYEACAAGYIADSESDILTVRYAAATPVAALTDNGLYLRDNTDSGVIINGIEAAKGLIDNELMPIAGNEVAILDRPLVSNAYYVADSGRACPGGVAIPELRRVRLVRNTGLPVWESIASGVEQIQVRYLLDGAYVDADAVIGDDWLAVRAVRVWLLVRGECPEFSLVNDTTYQIADLPAFTPNDNFRRQLYISTVMLRNTVVGDPG